MSELLEELEVPTAAYQYWVGRKDQEISLNPHLTSRKKDAKMLGDSIDDLVRREDHREALEEAVEKAQKRERRRTLNKIKDKIESLEENIEESVHSRHELGNCHSKGGIDNLEELEEEVESLE